MLSSRLNAFVIPTSQTTATSTATMSFVNSSTRRPHAITIAAAANCATSFGSGPRWKTSSSSPAAKISVQPATIPSTSVADVDHAGRDGHADACDEAAEDPDPAERRRRRVVPALAGGHRDQPLPETRVQQQPDDEICDGQGGDRDGRAHRA